MIGTSILGLGIGAVSNAINNAQQERYLGLQYDYNERVAKNNQERNKELWDYTNYENQVKHLKAAGLNPALLYGSTGGGGQSAAGGNGMGVGLPTSKAGQLMIEGLQTSKLQSEINLNNATAKEKDANASNLEKDTEKKGYEIENLIQLTKNEEEKRNLIVADKNYKESLKALTDKEGAKTGLECWELVRNIKLLDRQISMADVDLEIKQQTKETIIEQTKASLAETWARQKEYLTQAGLNQAETEQIGEIIKQEWRRVEIEQQNADTNQKNANTNARNASTNRFNSIINYKNWETLNKDVENKIQIRLKEIGIKESLRTNTIVQQSIHSACEVAGTAANILTLGLTGSPATGAPAPAGDGSMWLP